MSKTGRGQEQGDQDGGPHVDAFVVVLSGKCLVSERGNSNKLAGDAGSQNAE